MPRANTDLAALLAGDDVLCVQRPSSADTAQRAPATPTATTGDATTGPQVADADLARLTEVWPSLSGHTRAAIVAMINEPTAHET